MTVRTRADALDLFGAYKGTVRESGFHWGNPFYTSGSNPAAQLTLAANASRQKGDAAPAGQRILGRNKISLRARTLNGEILKVNDKRGNPIEIAAVVVWRVHDTAQAVFDVDNYEKYVVTQSESALRHLASLYAYDNGEDQESTLRSNVDEISLALQRELQERLGKAGVVVDEARLTHLAYAPEIAQAMLRRQQAEAVIAARQKIVHGAVNRCTNRNLFLKNHPQFHHRSAMRRRGLARRVEEGTAILVRGHQWASPSA